MYRLITAALLALAAHGAGAGDPPSVAFSHNDWELVCDNTRTCRAAGYQDDEPGNAGVTVLLTRAAGPRQPVLGQVQFGNYGSDSPAVPAVLTLKINGRKVGTVKPPKGTLTADLSPAQVTALLAALGKTSTIEWVGGEQTWNLSSKGAAAALLKMDEVQGRLGTVGALMRKGPKSEDAVLPPVPAPVIIAAPVPAGELAKAALAALDQEAVAAELRKAIKLEDCDERETIGTPENPLRFWPLASDKLLVSANCWQAAYNSGSVFAVVNSRAPHAPVLATTMGSEYNDGVIEMIQKGRGLGDCMASEDWTWDGRQFIHTHATWTGMCRLIAPGGAWDLPTLVTTVKPAAGGPP